MLTRIARRLAWRAGFDVTRISATWRDHPIARNDIGRASRQDLAIARQVEPYTGTSFARVAALIQAVRYLVRYRIPGDIVECGVWRGGSMMAAALTLVSEGETSRQLYLFDTFEGMSPPTEKDKDTRGVAAQEILDATPYGSGVWCCAGLDEVRINMTRTGYPADKVRFVKGRVEQTIPHAEVDRVALLRLDTDWYESTLHELNHLYAKLSPGGVLIIDDYGTWQGARQATDEFFQTHREYPTLLTPIDETGRIAIKLPAQNGVPNTGSSTPV